MPETRISYKRENKPNTLVFPSTSTTLSINPDAAFPRKLQRQSIQMDGTSVMPLFDSLELKQIKIQRLDFLGIFMLICTALGKLLQLNSNSFRAVRAIQVPTSNFHTPQSLSHKLSSTQCIIFSWKKIYQEHQAGSPSVQISRADLTHPLFIFFAFHPDLYCLL